MSGDETVDQPDILIREDFLPSAAELFAALERDVAWESRIKKRKTASFGVPFNYSGITYDYCDMHPLLVPVCDKLESEVGYRPNNCLMNYYETGSSTMGFHVDATDHLTPGTGVAIVSLGSERSITFRNIEKPDLQKDYRLKSGSLLYMPNAVQEHWRHAVLKEPGAGGRISLTFRQIAGTAAQ